MARLVELAPTLSPEARTAFAGQLQAAGLSIKESANAFLELPPELQKKLGLPPGKQLQLERAVKLLVITTELALALDQFAWALWKQSAPKSAIRKETELKRAGRLLPGGRCGSLDRPIDPAGRKDPPAHRRACWVRSAAPGSSYAKNYVTRLSPGGHRGLGEDGKEVERKPLRSACWKQICPAGQGTRFRAGD